VGQFELNDRSSDTQILQEFGLQAGVGFEEFIS
jgi:hypothetical protein